MCHRVGAFGFSGCPEVAALAQSATQYGLRVAQHGCQGPKAHLPPMATSHPGHDEQNSRPISVPTGATALERPSH